MVAPRRSVEFNGANVAPPPRFLITAPRLLRLDAVETVLLQLFGFPAEVTVHVFLKTSMAPDHVVLAQEAIRLNTQNQHQATAKVRVRTAAADLTAAATATTINKLCLFPSSCSRVSCRGARVM